MTIVTSMKKTTVLMILDGWGYRPEKEYNAVALANTPNWDRLWSTYPHTFLKTSGLDVGLPPGQMGNSEVGHTNIGAGRVVMMDLPRIDTSINDGTLSKNKILQNFMQKITGHSCHLMGLLSPGGVHSHQDHLVALANILDAAGAQVHLHLFMDGRDTPPKSGVDYFKTFLNDIKNLTRVKIATLSGRYYAMDRDKRWERTKLSFDAIVHADAEKTADFAAAIEQSYARGETDEFIKPWVAADYKGLQPGDGILSANFRSDRVRQILNALLLPDFKDFERGTLNISAAVGMTHYSDVLEPYMGILFPPQDLSDTLGEVVAKHKLTQLRMAETEKYPHVTFFFNGGVEAPFANEDRTLVPSPKVATYDLQPEMSAPELGQKLKDAILSGKYDFIMINFANPDMVGHTGDLNAAIKACETVDHWLGEAAQAIEKTGGSLIVTADHGNAEQMYDPITKGPHTAHTLNVVPVIVVTKDAKTITLQDGGRLADLAPSVLTLMHLQQPAAMTGISLIQRAD